MHHPKVAGPPTPSYLRQWLRDYRFGYIFQKYPCFCAEIRLELLIFSATTRASARTIPGRAVTSKRTFWLSVKHPKNRTNARKSIILVWYPPCSFIFTWYGSFHFQNQILIQWVLSCAMMFVTFSFMCFSVLHVAGSQVEYVPRKSWSFSKHGCSKVCRIHEPGLKRSWTWFNLVFDRLYTVLTFWIQPTLMV